MIFALVLAFATGSYGATIEQATARVLYARNGEHVIIGRINVVGRYATVFTKNGLMEGSRADVPILFEHFSFGWQGIESLNFSCRLEAHRISKHDRILLMRGMPQPRHDRTCDIGSVYDVGPPRLIEDLRRKVRGPLVPVVTVVGRFALVGWYGAGGGDDVFRRTAGRWDLIADGGGAIGVSEMRALGIPQADLCALGVYDAKCPPRR
jgi:hypothetical protein